jgi:hypothetical protein
MKFSDQFGVLVERQWRSFLIAGCSAKQTRINKADTVVIAAL